MDEEAKKIITERFKILPQNVQKAIFSADLPGKLKSTVEKYNLRIDQGGVLETEVNLIMLGLEHPDSFAGNVQKEVGVSQEVAEQIISDINNNILLPIRETLREMQKEKIDAPPAQAPTVQRAPAATPEKEGAEERAKEEGNVPENLPTGDISSLKLGGVFKVPQEQKQSSVPIEEKPGRQVKEEYGTDPYREPIE
jgi:hypothetical protein